NQLNNEDSTASNIEEEEQQNLEDQEEIQEEQKEEEEKEEEEKEEEEKEEAVLDNKIIIKASDTVWLTIDLDGNNVFSGVLEAGEEEEFELEERLYMKIGNGGAITAEIGGEDYGPWAGNGEIAEVEFLEENQEISINNLRE
ncbi:MAG: RodZ domain-containing protein, partial [Halanaerobium sp.]